MTKTALKQEFIDQAASIFHHNLQHGHSQRRGGDYRFIAPANKEYIFQWLWDTCFHAIVLSHFDPQWARQEMRSLMSGQWPDGFLPHVIFWQDSKVLAHWAYIESKPFQIHPQSTALTQPPMPAIALEILHKRAPDEAFINELAPKILRYHQWLKQNRDPDNDDLISIISPNESGMDELPVFQYAVGFMGMDPARLHYYFRRTDLLNQWYFYNNKRIFKHDYFNVEELLFNTVYVEACHSLSRLLDEIGEKETSKLMAQQAENTEKAIIKKCWDFQDKIFYSLFSKDEKMAKVKTAASLVPLMLSGLPAIQAKHLIEHLTNPQEFWTEFPVPSVAADEPYFEPGDTPFHRGKLLFRGPTWLNLNWLIVRGLRQHGYHQLADRIVDQAAEMVKKHGFREYYNPHTGEGYRRQNFGWSTLIVDLLDPN